MSDCAQGQFHCGKDCCGPEQFCGHHEERCIWCRTVDTVCGTDGMPAQCKHYCHMLLDHQAQTDTNPSAGHTWAIVAFAVCALLVFLLIGGIVYVFVRRPKWIRRRFNRSRDVENPSEMNPGTKETEQITAGLSEPEQKSLEPDKDIDLETDNPKNPLLDKTTSDNSRDLSSAQGPQPKNHGKRGSDHLADTTHLGLVPHSDSKDSVPGNATEESVSGNARDVHDVSTSSSEAPPTQLSGRRSTSTQLSGGRSEAERVEIGPEVERTNLVQRGTSSCPGPQQPAQNVPPFPDNGDRRSNENTAERCQPRTTTNRNDADPHEVHGGCRHPLAEGSPSITINNTINNNISHPSTNGPGYNVAAQGLGYDVGAFRGPSGSQAAPPHSPDRAGGAQDQATFQPTAPAPHGGSHFGPQSQGQANVHPSSLRPPNSHNYYGSHGYPAGARDFHVRERRPSDDHQEQGSVHGNHSGQCRDPRLSSMPPTTPSEAEDTMAFAIGGANRTIPPNARLEQGD